MHGLLKGNRLLNPDFRDMLSTFSDESVEFRVVGAYALATYGLPRATGDIDLWIRPSPENAKRVWHALVHYGAALSGLTADDLSTPGLVIQIGVAPRRIDILTSIDGVLFEEAQPQCEVRTIEDLEVPVIGRLDLLRNKRASGRPQDIADIAWLEAFETNRDETR